MSPPWMPLYIARYRVDTVHLNATEHGAYLLLIMRYWEAGSLPDDDRHLARIACVSDREWRSVKPVVQAFFYDGWKHKRIDAELAKAAEKISKRSAAAQQMHDRRRSKRDANAGANAGANAHANEDARRDANGLTRAVPHSTKEGSEANASGADAPPTDPVKRVWWEGVPLLKAMGLSDRDSRANIGRWLKTHSPEEVLDAIRRARDHETQDPVPLVGRILKPLGKPNGKPQNTISRGFAELREELGLDEARGDLVGDFEGGVSPRTVQRLPGRC